MALNLSLPDLSLPDLSMPDLSVLEGEFTIHRLDSDAVIPEGIFRGAFCSVTRTGDELSIVCPSSVHVDSERAESGWSCIKVAGPLDFSLTGILAELASVLAGAAISIFAVSTFDTDYLLVKSEKIAAAKNVLQDAGYIFRD